MSRYCTADRILIAVSIAWLVLLGCKSDFHERRSAFAFTLAVIACNAVISFRALTQRREVLIALNGVQIVLFGVLNHQLCAAFGSSHYQFDRPPRFVDWIEFTLAHVVRAADFLDALDEYGPIQTITHRSSAAGFLLVAMHLTVDAFLISLALRWLRSHWPEPPRETYLERDRRIVGWLLATLAFYVVFGVMQGFRLNDWLLWPLENLLRLLDVGDLFQVFHWQLHSVEPTAWSRGGAIVFRMAAGIWMARIIIHVRVRLLRTWGVSIEDLMEHLDDPDAAVRRNAALGLGYSGPASSAAVAPLCDALHDLDVQVRRAAAWALGEIGPPAEPAVPRLLNAAWGEEPELRRAAIGALAGIGPSARSAAYSLVSLLKISGECERASLLHALARVAPDIAWEQAIRPTLPPHHPSPLPVKQKRWRASLDAATQRSAMESQLRDQLRMLAAADFFEPERDLDSINAALAARGVEVAPALLVIPLLDLTGSGTLFRRRDDAGQWVYSARRMVPRRRDERIHG